MNRSFPLVWLKLPLVTDWQFDSTHTFWINFFEKKKKFPQKKISASLFQVPPDKPILVRTFYAFLFSWIKVQKFNGRQILQRLGQLYAANSIQEKNSAASTEVLFPSKKKKVIYLSYLFRFYPEQRCSHGQISLKNIYIYNHKWYKFTQK